MTKPFSTPVGECVAVVVDPEHERFGEIATIGMHDWIHSGLVAVHYKGGGSDTFNDGLMSDDSILPGVMIVRGDDERLEGFIGGLSDVRDDLRIAKGEVAADGTVVRSMESKRAFKGILNVLLEPET